MFYLELEMRLCMMVFCNRDECGLDGWVFLIVNIVYDDFIRVDKLRVFYIVMVWNLIRVEWCEVSEGSLVMNK